MKANTSKCKIHAHRMMTQMMISLDTRRGHSVGTAIGCTHSSSENCQLPFPGKQFAVADVQLVVPGHIARRAAHGMGRISRV